MENDSISNIHDTYFKFVFSKLENVKTFIEEFFPEIAKYVEIESIEADPTEKFSAETKEKSYLDFVANCKIKGEPSKIYFLFEHKSNPDKRIILQLIRYIISVWEEDIVNERELTPILPIVFYNGERKWNIEQDTSERFKDFPKEIRDHLLSFRYLLFDVNSLRDEDIKQRINRNRMFMIALDVMRARLKGEDEEVVFEMLRELGRLVIEHRERFREDIAIFLKMSIIYVEQVTKIEPHRLKERLLSEEDKEMLSVVDLIEQEAEIKGIMKGQMEGKILEAQEMVLAAIEAKIDYVPEWVSSKILQITDHQYLQSLLKQIVKSNDVESLLRESLSTI